MGFSQGPHEGANRSAIGRDEAVSPVIATILMVAITVVLAAVYPFVSGFNAGPGIVTGSYAAKSVDYPLGTKDVDTSDDAIDLTYTSGDSNFANSEIQIVVEDTTLEVHDDGST